MRKVYLISYRYGSTCSTLGPRIVIISSKYTVICCNHLSEGSTIISSHTIPNLNTTCHPSRSPSPLAVLALPGLVAHDGRPLIHVDPRDWTAINRNRNDDGMNSPRNKLILGGICKTKLNNPFGTLLIVSLGNSEAPVKS